MYSFITRLDAALPLLPIRPGVHQSSSPPSFPLPPTASGKKRENSNFRDHYRRSGATQFERMVKPAFSKKPSSLCCTRVTLSIRLLWFTYIRATLAVGSYILAELGEKATEREEAQRVFKVFAADEITRSLSLSQLWFE